MNNGDLDIEFFVSSDEAPAKIEEYVARQFAGKVLELDQAAEKLEARVGGLHARLQEVEMQLLATPRYRRYPPRHGKNRSSPNTNFDQRADVTGESDSPGVGSGAPKIKSISKPQAADTAEASAIEDGSEWHWIDRTKFGVCALLAIALLAAEFFLCWIGINESPIKHKLAPGKSSIVVGLLSIFGLVATTLLKFVPEFLPGADSRASRRYGLAYTGITLVCALIWFSAYLLGVNPATEGEGGSSTSFAIPFFGLRYRGNLAILLFFGAGIIGSIFGAAALFIAAERILISKGKLVKNPDWKPLDEDRDSISALLHATESERRKILDDRAALETEILNTKSELTRRVENERAAKNDRLAAKIKEAIAESKAKCGELEGQYKADIDAAHKNGVKNVEPLLKNKQMMLEEEQKRHAELEKQLKELTGK